MHLTHLSLTNFRNFARLDLDFPQGTVLVVGGNAQGISCLLEAIYFLSTFVSFHANSDRQLINFLVNREPLAVARMVADFYREDNPHRIEVRIIQETNGYNGISRLRKEVLIDGVQRKVSEVVGQFSATLFLPQMMRVVEGSPEHRRRYLNLTLAQVFPFYAPTLAVYNRALSQRNALLKQIYQRDGDPEQLAFWDEKLSAAGAKLIHARIHSIQELERLASSAHRQLARGDEVLRLSYEPAYDPLPQPIKQYALPLSGPLDRSSISLEKIQEGFYGNLIRLRSEEIARGVTTTGPHRDELRFLCNGIDLGVYGSRGQVRTAMLALKLAEVNWVKKKTGHWPVLLLDEVLAELDTRRRADLLSHLVECKQVVLTTTDLNLFEPDFVRKATLWHIHGGSLVDENSG